MKSKDLRQRAMIENFNILYAAKCACCDSVQTKHRCRACASAGCQYGTPCKAGS